METLQAFLSTSVTEAVPANAQGTQKNMNSLLEGLTYSQRRALKLRMLSRKIEFEQLQTDLEMLTEMLSGTILSLCFLVAVFAGCSWLLLFKFCRCCGSSTSAGLAIPDTAGDQGRTQQTLGIRKCIIFVDTGGRVYNQGSERA
jgi:hypothetical protein